MQHTYIHALAGVWFVISQFWFLDIAVSGLHLHTICKMALAALLPALMVPGLVYAKAPRSVTGVVLMLQVRLRHTRYCVKFGQRACGLGSI